LQDISFTVSVCIAIEKDKMKGIDWHPKDQGKVDQNSRMNSLQPEENDAGQFMSRPVLLNQPYLEIQISGEDNLGGIGNIIQRATKSYFMKPFQFQRLLGQNEPSMEVQQSGLGSLVEVLVDSCLTEVLHHTKPGVRSMFRLGLDQLRGLLQVSFEGD
jgi:hypothetical protein